MKAPLVILLISFTLLGSSCVGVLPDQKALPSSPASSPLPEIIKESNTNTKAALQAAENKYVALSNQTSVAAAQVTSVVIANTNQPPSKATEIVAREASLALSNLPLPDAKELLEAERRRSALFSGQIKEANELYKIAQQEIENNKKENLILKKNAESSQKKTEMSQLALVEADKKWSDQLKVNQLANQSKIDKALKAADEAQTKAAEGNHKMIFRVLLGLGVLCIAGSIALAVLTNGAMVAKSLILLFSGICCVGVAQVVSNPWFDAVFVSLVAAIVIASIAYVIYERKDSLTKETLNRMVPVIDELGIAKGKDGELLPFGNALSIALDESHKKIIKSIKADNLLNRRG